MKINQIWRELENDTSTSKGLLLRRYSSLILPELFIGLTVPDRHRCIAAVINTASEINLSFLVKLKDISIEVIPNEKDINKSILLFKLISQEHRDVFSVLSEDLITSVANETNESRFVSTLLNRFEKWKSLFTKMTLQKLSPEEQRGLYGELYFLRKYLSTHSNTFNTVNSWVGPSKEVRDFQFNSWALEVKTTLGNNHQKVHISNERQLDNTHLQDLFLYHISLELAQESGETLNQIISSINAILEIDLISKNRFKAKLYEVGYFEHQASLYESIGYHIRQDNFYLVENEFPRIQEGEIRSGVGDVKYSIILSQCQDYLQTEQQVFQKISTE